MKYLRFVFVIQLFAATIKLWLIGISEHGGIGTMSLTSGSLSTIFPLLAFSIILPFYLYKKCSLKVFVILALSYLAFGIIGNKRALAIIYPGLTIVLYLIYRYKSKKTFSFSGLRIFLLIITASIFFFYVMLKTLPTLNPENTVWGSFNPEYFLRYTKQYTSSEYKTKTEMRRIETLSYLPNYLRSKGIYRYLFGDGPGIILSTKHIAGHESGGLRLKRYGIRYGGRMGLMWLWVQIGLVGTISYILLLTYLIRKSIIRTNNKILHLIIWGLVLIIIFDFVYYSYEFVKNIQINGVFFFILAISMRNLNIDIFSRSKKCIGYVQ